jgi:hypothetical protein
VAHRPGISSGGIEREVTFAEEGDPAANDRVDAAYRGKNGLNFGVPDAEKGARAPRMVAGPRRRWSEWRWGDHSLPCRRGDRVARSGHDAQLLMWPRFELLLPEGMFLRV